MPLSRRRGETGSVLALAPAGFLVLVVLGAIAVDSAATFLGQRQLADAVSAAATDAASAAVSNQALYTDGAITIDPLVAAQVICQSVAAQGDGDLHNVRLAMAVNGPVVRVHATATVNAVFGRALSGAARREVQADATATAAEGPLPEVAPAGPTDTDNLAQISC